MPWQRRVESLLSPIRLGGYVLPNRIVMAPMTRSRAAAGNVPHPMAPTYYAQRAAAGLIITEAAQIAPEAASCPGTPGIHEASQVTAWRMVTRAVHAEGGRIFLQLFHAGRISHPSTQPNGVLPVAPTAIQPDGIICTAQGRQPLVTPRALEAWEIRGLVETFARSASFAREAEFDGIDIHAANGYLIDQFLRDGSNHRTDLYGGPIANRARFLLEIVDAVATVWSPERVGVRLSPLNPHNSMHDSNPLLTSSYVAAALARMNIGYLHIAEPGPTHPLASAASSELLRRMRTLFPGRLSVDGGHNRTSAEVTFAAVKADLIALATPFIANPDLVDRFARNLPLAVPDRETFYEGGEHGYTDYPLFTPQPSSESRRLSPSSAASPPIDGDQGQRERVS
jgi:N-ethylmaleimide reductase